MNLKVAPRMHRVGLNLVQSKHHLLGFAYHIFILFNIRVIASRNSSNISEKAFYKIIEYLNYDNVHLFNEEYQKYLKYAQNRHFLAFRRVSRLCI